MAYINYRFVSAADSVVSDLICQQTGSPYSHVELLLDDGTALGAHLDGGVKVRPRDYQKLALETILKLPCTDEGKAAGLAFATSCVGYAYDILDIPGILLHLDLSCGPKHCICSFFGALVSIHAGSPLLRFPKEVKWITPRDLLLSPLLVE